MDQGSDDWRRLRLGKVTASRVADVVARTKTGWGASRANYAAELILERLTGCWQEGYTSPAMLHGTATEPYARQAYSLATGVDVFECAFVDHSEIAMTGASPDGLVGDDGLLEVKCPQSATHLETLLSGDVPAKYVTQMMWQMACTGRQWCDFASFDPRMPEPMRLFVKRIPRDPSMVLGLESDVSEFLRELDSKVADLRHRYMPEAKAA